MSATGAGAASGADRGDRVIVLLRGGRELLIRHGQLHPRVLHRICIVKLEADRVVLGSNALRRCRFLRRHEPRLYLLSPVLLSVPTQ